MLPRKYRLPSSFFTHKPPHADRVVTTELFVARWYKSNNDFMRVGVVVPNKVISGAVARNRIRRQVHTVINSRGWHKRAGYDMVFYAKPALSDASSSDIEVALDKVFKEKK